MINYLAVLVAAIASMALGALWYSPLLFGNLWMRLMKLDPKKMNHKHMNLSYGGNFLADLVTAYVVAVFSGVSQTATALGGGLIAFWLWLGFVATTTLGNVLWQNKPFKAYLLDNAFHLLRLVIIGVIIAVWV